ncbi:asparaginase domain-containing protein [Actinomycetospora sp. CA-053990]|uniref:asparaginase domain-containing protein n=1 Tax=Actinomycetospora sp. CA-053990 TaxID=3239891 RepID=UPI003D9059DB
MPVHLVATGGTIASTGFPGPLRAARDGRALLDAAGADADVAVTDLATAGSFAMGWDDLRRLRTAVATALDEGADGVVVTHGTDTMEESAYGLDLLLADHRPVVLTGAQRAADEPGADGPANLRAALTLASDPPRGATGCSSASTTRRSRPVASRSVTPSPPAPSADRSCTAWSTGRSGA